MLLFYLITLLHGSNSLPLSFVENVEMPLANVERDINTTVDSTVMPDNININTTKDVTVLADTTTKDVTVLEEIKSNPQKFISEVQNLDPVALRHIISLLNDLLEKSQARENELDTDLQNKKKALSDADEDVVNAGDVLDDANQAVADAEIVVGEKQDLVTDAENKVTEAQGAVTEAQAVVGEKQGVATAAESDLAAKKEVHKEKKAAKEASEKAHNDEVPDLNDEQEVLAHVIAILEELHGKQGSDESIGCADDSIEQVFQEDKMVGCDGSFVNTNFREACANGWHVATASDYFAFGGKTVRPTIKRWVDVAWDVNGHETSLENGNTGYYDIRNSGAWDGVGTHSGCSWISSTEQCTLSFANKDYGKSYGCHCRGGNPSTSAHGVVCAKD